MRLTVIGCAGSFPAPASACSCYLVEAEGFRLLLDLGTGALGALQTYVGLYDVDAVVLSHLHADHCFDVCSYVVPLRHGEHGQLPRLPVHAPAGAGDRLAAAYGEGPLDDVLDTIDLTAGRREIGPFTVTSAPVNHPVEAYALRVEHGGRVLAYSGDTGPADGLLSVARDADALLCEASFADGADNPPNLHLTGGQAGGYARRADAGRLLLTHLVAWGDPERTREAAAAAYAGPVERVAPGARYDL